MTRAAARWAVVLAAATALASGTGAMGQNEPVIIGQREELPRFYLTPPDAAMEFTGRYERSRRATINQPEQVESETLFREELELRTTGHIVHPNLVELDLWGRFGPEQHWFDIDGEDDWRNNLAYEYDARATVLRKENYPFTLYSRRIEQWLAQPFGPSLRDTTQTTGAQMTIKSDTLPTDLQIEHSDESQTGILDEIGYEISRDTFNWHSEARPTDRQLWTWDYSFNHVEQSAGTVSTNYDTHNATLAHTLNFGDGGAHSLQSTLDATEQTGDYPYNRIRWNETLRLRHTPNFETFYLYNFDHQTLSSLSQDQHRGEAGFTHRLYKSLTTTGRVGGLYLSEDPTGTTSEYYVNLATDYRKKVPYGLLTAGVAGGFDGQVNSPRSQSRPVIDQGAAFTDPTPIVLIGRNIVPGSVAVTDPSGIVTYVRGIDYTLTTFPDRIEIERILGGRLGDGQAVLIDYLVGPTPASNIDTTSFSVGARYDIQEGFLRGLAVYSRFAIQDQAIDSPNPDVLVNGSYRDVLAGTEYRIGDFTFSAERQWHDADVLPYDATRLAARYLRRLSMDSTLGLNLANTAIDYTDSGQTSDLTTASATLNYDFSRRFDATLAVQGRYQDDSQTGVTVGFEQQAQLRWHYRQTEIALLARNSFLDSENSQTEFQVLQLVYRRRF